MSPRQPRQREGFLLILDAPSLLGSSSVSRCGRPLARSSAGPPLTSFLVPLVCLGDTRGFGCPTAPHFSCAVGADLGAWLLHVCLIRGENVWVVLLYLLPSSDGLAILLSSRSVSLAHCCPGSCSSETLAHKSSGQDFEVRQA